MHVVENIRGTDLSANKRERPPIKQEGEACSTENRTAEDTRGTFPPREEAGSTIWTCLAIRVPRDTSIKRKCTPPLDCQRAIFIGLEKGTRVGSFRISKVPLCSGLEQDAAEACPPREAR